MKIKNIMLFVYDFPHKKTQDFIFRLLTEVYNIKYCIGAPWKKLPISNPSIKIAQTHVGLIHPKKICKIFKIDYHSFDHNSLKTIKYINKHPVDLAIIGGARILSDSVIKACKNKVLNIHPGLLPEARGLDTLLWSIHNDIPLGISAHFINSKIDSGLLVYKERLDLLKDDTILDVSLRLLEYQSEILIKSLNILKKSNKNSFKLLSKCSDKYYSKMNSKTEKLTIKMFQRWLIKHTISQTKST